jgi:hypothetical protein
MKEITLAYTRAQAIQDGVLIDVSKLASEAGFKYPVAITHAAWADCIAAGAKDIDRNETGRLLDMLNQLRIQARRAITHLNRFDILVSNAREPANPVILKAFWGPGDDGKPVITVMLRWEDL